MIDARSPVPLFEQITLDLRRRIRTGALTANDQLPSESELAKEYSVSRMTARKGVDTLVLEGLIFRRPGKGTFVSPPKIPHGLSTRISFSAAMAALGLSHRTVVHVAERHRASAEIADLLEIDRRSPVVHIQRVRLIDDEPVALHETWLLAELSAILNADLTGSLTSSMLELGAVIVRSQDTVEAIAATREQADLLDITAGAPLVRIVGVGRGSDNRPLRATDALYRADRFRFSTDSDSPSLALNLAG